MNLRSLSTGGIAGFLLFVSSAAAQTESTTALHVEINFAGRIAGKAFTFGSRYEDVKASKSTVTPQDLRFFVSNVELLDAMDTAVPVNLDQDGIWQYKSLALVDLEDGKGACCNGNAAMHQAVSGSVPVDHYVRLRFVVGVPFDLDHIDPTTAPSPLNMTAMHWNWQGESKFIRAEVVLASAPQKAIRQDAAATQSQPSGKDTKAMRSSGFPVHIGSTGCGDGSETAAPEHEYKHPNRVVVALDKFDPAKDVVIFDIGKLLSEGDVTTNTPNTPPAACQPKVTLIAFRSWKALGLRYGDSPREDQVVFYAEAT